MGLRSGDEVCKACFGTVRHPLLRASFISHGSSCPTTCLFPSAGCYIRVCGPPSAACPLQAATAWVPGKQLFKTRDRAAAWERIVRTIARNPKTESQAGMETIYFLAEWAMAAFGFSPPQILFLKDGLQ